MGDVQLALAGPLGVVAIGVGLAALALGLRLLVHVGATPSGVDTWYYLASADELRRTRRLPISLPRYLLQDRTESYPPGFVVFLALLPRPFLLRYFWLVAPIIDTLHLLLLYAVTYRLTGSLSAAALGGLIYALVPQLIAETRSLNPRSLGVLIGSIAMFLALRMSLPDESAAGLLLGASPWPIAAASIVTIAALFLTHTTTGIAFGISTVVLTLVFADWRYFGLTVAGFLAAFVLSRGFYFQVLMNHVHALRFWRRNLRYRDADPLLDSPIYGSAANRSRARPVRWRSLRWQTLRLVGENPFVVPMFLISVPVLELEWWGQRMYWWAIAVVCWAAATTFVRPLRVFGPGYIYLKASIFPTAFSLALAIGARGLTSPMGLAVAAAAAMSVVAIAFFYIYVRTRTTERTSSEPPGLAKLTSTLAELESDGVLVLPTMYADYVCYKSGKRTLWGGHSGDLSRFEALSPRIRRPLDHLIAQYDLHYALIDLSYVDPAQIDLDGHLSEIARDGSFALFETKGSSR